MATAAALDPGEEHTRFVQWAEQKGVEINKVAPARFVDRGMGIVAASDIKKGDSLIRVRNTSLVHIALPKVKTLKLPDHVTVHGRLAASLALWHSNPDLQDYKPWQDVWPTEADFKTVMPFFYAQKLQSLLPQAALSLLKNQQTKLEKDWTDLLTHIPSINKELFTYTWMIVNTRTFYWDYPDLPNSHPRLPKRRTNLTADDCYAMCPFMDYFNHSDNGCTPTSDGKGYAVVGDRDYKAGEEVFISYGPHTNDFLLAEYGFILDKNANDSLSLDHLLIPLLSSEQVDGLKEDHFYGNYTLLPTRPVTCHRTQAVLRLLVLPRRYAAFVGGIDDGAKEQPRMDKYLTEILTKYTRQIVDIIEKVEALGTSAKPATRQRRLTSTGNAELKQKAIEDSQKAMVLKRWIQIRDFVHVAISNLEA